MKSRLLKARSLLKNEYKKLFKSKIYLNKQAVMVSDCFGYYLKQVPGETGVSLWKISEKDKQSLISEYEKAV